MKNKEILNFGCGQEKMKNAVNIDFNKSVKPDVVHNLNNLPYPFESNRFNTIYCYHILEHLDDIFKVMSELHRISKAGARVIIKSPHFSYVNAYQDPSHKHYFSISSFDYFTDKSQWSYYTDKKFEIVSKKVYFQKGIFCPIFSHIFNRFPNYYETKLAWIFPAEYIEITLETAK